MNYPQHICSFRNGNAQIAIFADGTVAQILLAAGGKSAPENGPPSRMTKAYELPEPIKHVVSGPADYYLIGWDAEGRAYAIEPRKYTRMEKLDIGSLEEMMADDAERDAERKAAELDQAKAKAERAQRQLEADRDRAESAKAALEEEAARVRSATSAAGNATKAARAARELAEKQKTAKTTTEPREATA